MRNPETRAQDRAGAAQIWRTRLLAALAPPDVTRFTWSEDMHPRGPGGKFLGTGGMKAEAGLHEHEAGRDAFIKEHGAKAFATRAKALTKEANAGAKSMTAEDRTSLDTEHARLKAVLLSPQATPAQREEAHHLMSMIESQQKRASAASTAAPREKLRAHAKPSYAPVVPLDNIPISMYEALDPAKMLHIYGAEQFPEFLRDLTLDRLKVGMRRTMRENPGTRPTSMANKEAVIKYIVDHTGAWDGKP